MNRPRLIALCGVIFLVAVLVSTGAIGGVGGITTASTDNETALHEHPDEVGSDGDLEGIEGWLSGRMGEIHLDCAEGVEIGEYDVCDRLDDDYPDFLSRYATVERDIEGDDETAETFEDTRDAQRAFADDDETFWEAYDEYEDARESGDDDRRRQAARELLEIAANMDQRSSTLTALFSQLGTQTGVEFEDAVDAVERSNEEVQETADVIETAEFIETDLTVERNATAASFEDPVELSGELVDESGEPIPDARIVLIVDDRRIVTTTTAEDGRYELAYRPTVTPTGDTELTVVYDPSMQSSYLGSEASTHVDVRPVEVALELADATDTVAYTETVRVTGLVGTDRPAPNVTVVGALDTLEVGSERTDADGAFELSTRLSADVPDGERTLDVRASEPGLALEPVETDSTVTVVETETELSVNGTYDGGSVQLDGRLVTVDGDPVADQTISGSVDGTEHTTATTDADGRYSMAIDATEADGNALNLSVHYSGSETNLGTSQAETTVRLPQGGAAGLQDAVVSTDIALAVVAILALAVLVIRFALSRPLVQAVLRRIRGGISTVVESIRRPFAVVWNAVSAVVANRFLSRLRRREEIDEPAETTAQSASDDSESASELNRTEQLFETAQRQLQNGFSTEAVTLGYASVREHFQSDSPIEATPTQTHREFYRDITNALPDEEKAALRTVTDAYEQAAFAPTEIDESTAEDALRAVRQCLDGSADLS